MRSTPLLPPSEVDRRGALETFRATATAAAAILVSEPSGAAETAGGSTKDLLAKMRPIPTFAIVDAVGVPYLIAEKQGGGATGYFFTTFSSAMKVLNDAKKDSQEKGYEDTWKDATITTVPLDVAIRLVFKKVKRKAQNDVELETIGDIIPSADDLNSADKIDPSGRYKQQGSVPLFYAAGLDIPLSGQEEIQRPLYFHRSDLLRDWAARNPGMPPPTIQVIDLVNAFRVVLKTGTETGADALRNAVFIPDDNTLAAAKELRARDISPGYKMGQMLMVGGK